MESPAAAATSTVPTQVLSVPESQQVQQGRARPQSPLALGVGLNRLGQAH